MAPGFAVIHLDFHWDESLALGCHPQKKAPPPLQSRHQRAQPAWCLPHHMLHQLCWSTSDGTDRQSRWSMQQDQALGLAKG